VRYFFFCTQQNLSIHFCSRFCVAHFSVEIFCVFLTCFFVHSIGLQVAIQIFFAILGRVGVCLQVKASPRTACSY